MKNRSGLTLILLVVTIIVIMLIAVTTILSFSSTNIKQDADKVKFQENITTYYQQLQEYIGNKKVEATASGKTYNPYTALELSNVTGSNMEKYIPQIKARYYTTLAIINGELVYVGSNATEKLWCANIIDVAYP